MRIPAIKAKIGDWDYYVATLTFNQVATRVSRVDEHLHHSEALSDLIQRSITDNFISIKNYILNQPERFFNSLVLAVYDDYPDWREIAFEYEGEETYRMGILEFAGHHRIFPVDGQHRVEGIKSALEDNPELGTEQIAVVFIGHRNDRAGTIRTRRLFTTLNRYAKPVSEDANIALDEDDTVAILTRELLEEFPLFTGPRVVYTQNKAIPVTNTQAITSIITLYQANTELIKLYLKGTDGRRPTAKKLETFKKFRPADAILNDYRTQLLEFWNAFVEGFTFLETYMTRTQNAAAGYRNSETGGNLLFRPVGLLPLVKASITISERTGANFITIFSRFSSVELQLNNVPWLSVLWNEGQRRMIVGHATMTELMLLYLYNPQLLQAAELQKLKSSYAAVLNVTEAEEINHILDNVGA